MATIIDSLLVTIGLDPSNFSKGRKQAAQELLNLRDTTEATGKRLEEAGKRGGEFFKTIRNEALAFFAALAAANGVKDFVADMTTANAELGRLSRNLGISASVLGDWGNASYIAGGSAEGMYDTFSKLSNELQNFQATGQSALIPYLRGLGNEGGHIINAYKPVSEVLLDITRNIDVIRTRNPARANWYLTQLGLNQDAINLVMMGSRALEQLLAMEKKFAPSPEDVRQAMALQMAWRENALQLQSIGRTILTDVSPALITLLDQFRDWVAANRQLIETRIAEYIHDFATWVKSVNWGLVAQQLEQMAAGAAHLVNQLGGFKNVSEVLFGLWVGAKFASFLANVVALRAATMMTLPAGSWLSALLGFGGIAIGGATVETYRLFTDPASRANALSNFVDPFGNVRRLERDLGGSGAGSSRGVPAPAGWEAGDIQSLMGKGFSRSAAEGIVANISAESRGSTTAVGDNGAAYGLGQWHSDRQQRFEDWAGHSIRNSTRAEQSAFYAYEMRKFYPRVYAALHNGSITPGMAARAVSIGYEAPGDQAGQAAYRAGLAGTYAGLPIGAQAAARSAQINNRSFANSHSTHIDTVNVHTQATDADGVARGLKSGIDKYTFASNFNTGAN